MIEIIRLLEPVTNFDSNITLLTQLLITLLISLTLSTKSLENASLVLMNSRGAGFCFSNPSTRGMFIHAPNN